MMVVNSLLLASLVDCGLDGCSELKVNWVGFGSKEINSVSGEHLLGLTMNDIFGRCTCGASQGSACLLSLLFLEKMQYRTGLH